jgi:hypothetical protein
LSNGRLLLALLVLCIQFLVTLFLIVVELEIGHGGMICLPGVVIFVLGVGTFNVLAPALPALRLMLEVQEVGCVYLPL